MASSRRGPWSHHRPSGLATLLFIVASIGVLSACWPRATRPSGAPSTPLQTSHTIYLTGQHGSVDALQSRNGSLRWHKQIDKEWSRTTSLVVFGDVLYVGRVTCPPDCQTSSPLIGSIDALKVSDGTVLWHAKVDVHNDASLSVQVMKVVKGVVYVGVDGGFSGDSAGEVYALQATNGSLLWHYTVKGECCRGLVVTDTTVYVGDTDRDRGGSYVDALKTSDGTVLWHHQIDRPSILLGIVAANGVVYVGTATADQSGSGIHKGAVDALRANDGTLLWHNQTNFPALVLTVADGIVYVGALFDSPLDALRASDGSLLWQYKGDLQVNQATVMDGVVFLTYESTGYKDIGSKVDALRISDGSLLWRYTIDPQDEALQVAVGDGMVYVYVSTLHGIVALDANRGNQRWFHAAHNVFALAVGP